MNQIVRVFIFAAMFFPMGCVAQSILPQIADGGGWQTEIVISNSGTSPLSVVLSCYQDTTQGATQNWNLPFLEGSTNQSLPVPPAGTLFLHTPGTDGAVSQGWCGLGGAGVEAYALYTFRGDSGRPNRVGTSPAGPGAGRILVPFDNTAGSVTSMAIVNLNASSAAAVSVNIQTDDGVISNATLPSLPANGQLAFVTAQQLPATSGKRGLAEFYVPLGNLISVMALAFDSTSAFTSAPVFAQAGPPIIGSAPTTALSALHLAVTFTPAGAIIPPPPFQITVIPNGDGTYTATFLGQTVIGTGPKALLLSSAAFLGGTAISQDTTFGFTNVASAQPTNPVWLSGALTFTLTQLVTENGSTTGTVSGTLSLVSTPASGGFVATGPISGTFIETLQ